MYIYVCVCTHKNHAQTTTAGTPCALPCMCIVTSQPSQRRAVQQETPSDRSLLGSYRYSMVIQNQQKQHNTSNRGCSHRSSNYTQLTATLHTPFAGVSVGALIYL